MTANPVVPPLAEPPETHFDLTLAKGQTEKLYWRELWRYRELFIILASRNISVRYKQTAIGIAWALIQPALTMVIMTIVFGRVAGLPSDGATPYAVLVFAGLLPWTFYSSSISSASSSLLGDSHLISKVYFPRLIVPASAVVTAFTDFLISFLLLIGLMIWYRFAPTWNILCLPLFIGLAFLAALGLGIFLAAINVKYRDFRYVVPFVVQFGLYVTPVGFSSTVIREKFGERLFLLYSLNPMVGIIDGFRWAILGNNSPIDLPSFSISILATAGSAVLGVWYFRKTEKTFADII